MYLYLQVSQVYQTMSIDNLSRIIPFFDFPVVEKISVDAVKNNFLTMKLDYRQGAIFFGNKVTILLIPYVFLSYLNIFFKEYSIFPSY